ncbi:MAG: hypothetical protein M3470_05230 [Chloroflexota bacterium]|nr:hypothetical protein [Chloroflexota bacterium]
MPRRFVAHPERGFPGKIEDEGKVVEALYKIAALVYDPGEVPPRRIELTTIGELRAKYWNPTRRALVIPGPGARPHTYEFGPELLDQTTDTTLVNVRPEVLIPGKFPRPKAAG